MSRIARHEYYASCPPVSALNPDAPPVEDSPGVDTEAGERAATNDEPSAAPAEIVGDPPKRTRKKAAAVVEPTA